MRRYFQHEKIKFVFPSGHVISPIYSCVAGVDLILLETYLVLQRYSGAVIMLISKNLHDKSSEVSIKTG